MPTAHEADALAAPVAAQYLQRRHPYVLRAGTDDPTDFVAGSHTWLLFYNGIFFERDPADTTSAHDGITTIVSNDGVRFKASTLPVLGRGIIGIIDKDLTAPPGGESVGDIYLVPVAATGDWSGHDKEVAVFTARGWFYLSPQKGQIVFAEDEGAYYHYSAAGTWTIGMGQFGLSAGSVKLSNLFLGPNIRVENQTTNTPPGSPAEGVAYVIGPTPTDAWAGHARKIAIYELGQWVIYTPSEGWTVYDKTIGRSYFYKSGTWQTEIPQSPLFNRLVHKISVAQSITSTLDTFATIAYQGVAGQEIEITLAGRFLMPTDGFVTAQLFVDAEGSPRVNLTLAAFGSTNAPAGFSHLITLPDSSSHDYILKMTRGTVATYTFNSGSYLVIEEYTS